MNHLDLNTLAAPSFARRCAWAGAVAALCAPMVSMAGFAALGSQQTVDDSSTSNEGAASIAVDASGNHVVVYKGQVGLDSNVYLRRYSAAGQTRGLASRVNSQTSGYQNFPDVAMTPGGGYVVVWESSSTPSRSDADILARRYAADGTPLGSEFVVNKTLAGSQVAPAVAVDANGNFVVAWRGPIVAGSTIRDAYVRRYNANGAPLGDDLRVLPQGFGSWNHGSIHVDIASDAKGNFVLVSEESTELGRASTLRFQRFDNYGNRKENGYLDEGIEVPGGHNPAISMTANGRFAITWEGYTTREREYYSDSHIRAQRFDAAGKALGASVRVNSYDYEAQLWPKISHDAYGDYAITWTTQHQDGDAGAVYARRYRDSGFSAGSEFRLNTVTAGDQSLPVIASDADGDLFTAWHSTDAAQTISGIASRRFRGDATVNLAATVAGGASYVVPGQTISYSSTISNSAAPQYPTGIAAIDTAIKSALKASIELSLPTGGSFATAPTLSAPGICTASGSSYICTLDRPLAAGAMASVSYTVKAGSGGTLTVRAVARSDSHDTYATDDVAEQVRTVTIQ